MPSEVEEVFLLKTKNSLLLLHAVWCKLKQK
jgi:hypothetical protein